VALVCIDLQPAFLKVVNDADKIQRRCAFAIAAAVGLELEVVFTEQVPEKVGPTSPTLLELVKNPVVFGKNTFSAWANAAVKEHFGTRKTEHVLMCGIETSVCIYQTALDVMAAGLQLTILSDCVGARRTNDADVCLGALVRAGAHVLPAETVFYSLLGNAQHPFFRAYTQLVKSSA